MPKQKNKNELLIDIQTERSRLENNLSDLSEEEMIQIGVTGMWSVKDILAHLAAWEGLLLDWYQAGIQARQPAINPVGMSRTSIDAVNSEIFEKNRQRGLEQVLDEFHTSYKQVMVTLEGIPEEDMFSRGRYAWTGKWTLADYIAGNTCNHYAWAKAQIRKRLRGK